MLLSLSVSLVAPMHCITCHALWSSENRPPPLVQGGLAVRKGLKRSLTAVAMPGAITLKVSDTMYLLIVRYTMELTNTTLTATVVGYC